MEDQNKKPADQVVNFDKRRIKDLEEIYSDPVSAKNKFRKSSSYDAPEVKNAAEIRSKMLSATSGDLDAILGLSQRTYATNPIYAAIIDYFSDMFLWRYTVVPHKLWSKTKGRPSKSKYDEIYRLMLEVAEGIHFENKFPFILAQLFIEGSVFFTTVCDKNSYTIDTIILPQKYCKKIGETQFGTAIINFDYSYFDTLGLSEKDKLEFLDTFPDDMQSGYSKYLEDRTNSRYQILEPHYSSCIMLNTKGLPTYLYSLGSILNYEQYGDNELARNENQLKYIVVHKIPHYEDQLLFEVDEVKAIHKSLAKIVNTSDKTRLITTYGDVDIKKIQDTENTENKVLEQSYESIFNNAGLNASIFTGSSVESLRYSLLKDKSLVWKFVQELINFYNTTINNCFDFGDYQADIAMLPISHYSYAEDVKTYRENATLGVGKLDFIVAAGIKQKDIQDRFDLENFLNLKQITPLQTSYTQTDTSRSITTSPNDESPEEIKENEGKNEKSKD